MIVYWTSIKALMVSLDSFLVTTLSGLTTILSEDLISLTIKPQRMIESVEETVVHQILDILCTSKGEEVHTYFHDRETWNLTIFRINCVCVCVRR